YIVEKNAFPNSVVEVATAVPAFIGHTEKADNKGKSLTGKPWRITSVAEYHQYFGFGPTPRFDIAENTGSPFDTAFKAGGKDYLLTQPAGP
ncbi:phage tail sheath family protein, partial [Vibrio parahaemolyticus]|nr:phage tail sheath family protein [Vibrio parahaemolyticus]